MKDDFHNPPMTQPSPMNELVDALSDRNITDEQLSQLNGMLETDAESRAEFMNLMRLEAELGAMHLPVERPALDPFALAVRDAGCSLESAPAPLAPSTDSRRPSRLLQSVWSIAGLAAMLAFAMVGSSWLTLQGVQGRGPLASVLSSGAEQRIEAVAQIAATRNCRWRGDRVGIGYGAELQGGQLLELETGVAELTFADGARLVLEGPAAFRIPDADTVELYVGRAAAAVPKEASRFSVRTPRLVVSDCGAQFGIVAGSDGRDEVHVFEGPVHARAVDTKGRVTRVVSLSNLQAARLGAADSGFAVVNADDQGFVRSLSTRSGPGGGLLAFDNFSYPTGPLAWQNGGFGWAGPWADLESPVDASGSVESTNLIERGSLSTADLVSLGNRLVQTGNANRVRRTLSTSIGGVFEAAGLIENYDGLRLIGRNGSTLYLSFLQRASKTDDVFYGFELHRGDGNFNRVLCIGNGAEGHGYGVTSNYHVEGRASFAPLGEEDTEANFFVVRIDFGEDNQDVATVYRNPRSPSDESSCVVSATLSGVFGFDRVSLGNFEGAKVHEIDEVRIGTEFAAVTGLPVVEEPRLAVGPPVLLRPAGTQLATALRLASAF